MAKKTIGKVRLDRALSKLGIASRTVAAEWISAGKVKVNGVLRTTADFLVTPETAKIEIDGEIAGKSVWKCLVFHKPKNCTVTRKDEKGRKTVFDILGEQGKGLHAVGRLDFATTGLLILTNDTKLSSFLTDPKNEIPRTYIVTVRGEITDQKLEKLQKGVRDAGEFLKPQSVSPIKISGKESLLEVTLTEGKNREIRRLFLAVGNEVIKLKRIAFGGLVLGEISVGDALEVSKSEILKIYPKLPISI